ncbi:hypothetical protein QUF58_11755 [Anaerolineales bacterium HSG24]|nr:hypothetical protein [Anaerolineales bacterium HSG24]
MKSGDFIEGRGLLWLDDNPVAAVDYHLAMPQESHFWLNPLAHLRFEADEHVGGFILVRPQDSDRIAQIQYTLQLSDQSKRLIQVERRYKEIRQEHQVKIAFWVKTIGMNPK